MPDLFIQPPAIDTMHIKAHDGGSGEASNIVYVPETINGSTGSRTMTTVEIAEAY